LTQTLSQLHQEQQYLRPCHVFERILQYFPLVTPGQWDELTTRKALKHLDLFKRMLYHWVNRARQPLTMEEALVLIQRYQAKDDLELPVEQDAFAEDAVRIMTVHGSKGLQFPVVFLAGVDRFRKSRESGLFTLDPQYPGKAGFGLMLNKWQEQPSLKKVVYDTVWKVPRNLEEELRLFYVGVTRAKNRLYLSSFSQSFPYVNPVFFRDKAVLALSPDEVPWLEGDDQNALATRLKARYVQPIVWEARSPRTLGEAHTDTALPPSSAASRPNPAAKLSITFDTVIHFAQCPTRGWLHHLLGAAPTTIKAEPLGYQPVQWGETLVIGWDVAWSGTSLEAWDTHRSWQKALLDCFCAQVNQPGPQITWLPLPEGNASCESSMPLETVLAHFEKACGAEAPGWRNLPIPDSEVLCTTCPYRTCCPVGQEA
jgi:hypothetical protein